MMPNSPLESIMTIKAQSKDGQVFDCEVEILNRPYRIVFTGLGYSSFEVKGCDLFESLVVLRKTLAEKGNILLCNGARLNV